MGFSNSWAQSTLNFKSLLASINYEQIKEDVKALSSIDSRVTGYPGAEQAANYILERFRELGISTVIQKYNVVVPLDSGSSLDVINSDGSIAERIKAYVLWPNSVQTSKTSGENVIEGPLLYGGSGKLEELRGKRIEGSIVLLDFNSEDKWLDIASMGAKAIIFIAPGDTSYTESIQKIVNVPIDLPRMWVSLEDGVHLKDLPSGSQVRINDNMTMVKTEAKNIIAMINGTEFPNDVIVVAAHYDTWSIVPALAPGADEATSISSLLELARQLTLNKPRRSVWLVALSGHWEALTGAREFTETYYFDPRVVAGNIKPWVFVGLDFSTDGNRPAILYRGHLYDYGSDAIIHRWTRWLDPQIFNVYIPSLQSQMGKNYQVEDGLQGTYGYWASISGPYILDNEPWAIAHGLAITVRTNDVERLGWGNPLSTFENVDFDNLKPQLEVAEAIVYGLLDDDKINMDYSSISPSRYLFEASGADIAGFLTVQGQVLTYNITKGWYDPVPNAVVTATRQGPEWSSYPFIRIYDISDSKGKFELHGISGYGYGSGYGRTDTWYFEAYHFDDKTGLIDYAPDLGQYGIQQVQFNYIVNRNPYPVTTIVFKCGSAVLYDLIDPMRMQPRTFLDPRFQNAGPPAVVWSSRPSSFQIFDFSTLSQPLFWGDVLIGYDTVGMVFVPPNTKFMLLYRVGPTFDMIGILLNATQQNPDGSGYLVTTDKQLTLNFTSYQFVRDLIALSNSRYNKLRMSFVRSAFSERSLSEALNRFKLAEKSLGEMDYVDAHLQVLIAWSWIVHGYSDTMSVISDTLSTNTIFFSIFLIFGLFFERLVFGAVGKKRFITLFGTLAILLLAYYLLHPAPKIATNFLMSPLSVSVEMLFVFVSLIFLNETLSIVRDVRRRMVGEHFSEGATIPLTFMAFSYGIENMRRRRSRTIMVMASVAVVTFAMVALTSSYPAPIVSYAPSSNSVPVYVGTLIKPDVLQAPKNILSPDFADFIREQINFEYPVSRRVWWYPQSHGGKEVYARLFNADNMSLTFTIKAMVGMSPEEVNITSYGSAVKGLWFDKNSYSACIIPEEAAKSLGVDIGGSIMLGQRKLRVIGIYDSSLYSSYVDLDGYPITPVDPNNVIALKVGMVLQEQRIPMSWNEVMIVPDQLALDLGGYVASVAAGITNSTDRSILCNSLASTIQGSQIYSSDGKTVLAPSPNLSFGMGGWTYMIMPLFIGALTILNTILGNVKERTYEIGVYSAVGVSPRGISLIFLAEAMIYALTAAVLGYLLGILGNILLISAKMLPTNYIVNSSSTATELAIGVSMLFTLAATAYPAMVAARLVTPSLERKWKMATKPKGETWDIPLPFSMPSIQEAQGVLRYINEYLIAHTVETSEAFIVRDSRVEREGLISTMALQPIEAEIIQELSIEISQATSAQRAQFRIVIKKLSGPSEIWESVNYKVVDVVRKQFLMWRSLKPEQRVKYMDKEMR